MTLPYDLVTGAYRAGIRVAAPFLPKAGEWVRGRRGLWDRLEEKRDALKGCIWMHSASVGEFEQGLPVLEALRTEHPDLPVLLTFFSPSGYQARKDHPIATHVEYLPADTAANAARMLGLVRPRMVLWVKYEFWHHFLSALRQAAVPTFLVSGTFRRDQLFFRWYGGTWRRMLSAFTHLFVQDERSGDLLEALGVRNVTVSGDTRFDRVQAIVREDRTLPIAEAFRKASELPVLVAGSTWPLDVRLLTEAMRSMRRPLRSFVAPHELEKGTDEALRPFPPPHARWSAMEELLARTTPTGGSDFPEDDPLYARTLLVDRYGLLSRLYKYGDIAYVGGGFNNGIHSILEAAAWGLPVLFGPKHDKFLEARELIAAGGGFVVNNPAEAADVLARLATDPTELVLAGQAAGAYVRSRAGATEKVVQGVRQVMRPV